MVKVKCSRCGINISRYPNDVKEKNYCSVRCARIKQKIASVCIVCGKTKYYLPYQLRKSHGYCSLQCSKLNENNPFWKGKDVGYSALHQWVKRRLRKPDFCTVCNQRRAIDLANISQKYKRNITDWEWLCRHCHMTKDGRIFNLKKGSSKDVQRDAGGKFLSGVES